MSHRAGDPPLPPAPPPPPPPPPAPATGETPPVTVAETAPGTAPETGPETTATHQDSRLLRHSAVMAAGTVFSRASGLVRSVLLTIALGSGVAGDVFNVANTIPTMVYILLAGGVFNAVLVPQLVRALRHDDDRGQAYTDRVVTAFGLLLAVATIGLVAASPWLVQLYVTDDFSPAARASLVDLTRYCLPQVFFYGMFVLVGQVLNARGRFGPMMWAPIANNVIATGVLVAYLLAFGTRTSGDGALSGGRELLLGLGSTAGIVAQLLILLPYLRAAGYRFHPRLDLRGTGLGTTARLGVWTLLFVVVNQVAYLVVVRLATSGTADGGTGYTVYSFSFLLVMVPHSVVTVSLATALLPLLSERAAAGDRHGLAESLSRTLRTALAVVLPVAGLLPVVGGDLGRLLFGAGAGATTASGYGPTLAVFGVAFVAFTVHYLVLRGFYALERNRTVFLVQCAVAATNIAVAVVLVRRADPADTAPALAVAYGCAYLVGATVSYSVLRRALGGLHTGLLVGFAVRMLVAVGAATGVTLVLAGLLPAADGSQVVAAARLAVLGAVGVVVVVGLALVLRIEELTGLLAPVLGRVLPRRWLVARGGAHRSTVGTRRDGD